MSVETWRPVAEELDGAWQPRLLTPAEMIARQQPARRVFDIFRERYTGDPQQFAETEKVVHRVDPKDKSKTITSTYTITHGPFILERLGFRYPDINRTRNAHGDTKYPGVLATGFTDLGKMVHVRHATAANGEPDYYFVAVGNFMTGTVEEPGVIEVRHQMDINQKLHTTLFLEGGEEGWPMEYWPQVVFTPEAVSYYPGGDRRVERLQGIDQLYPRTMGHTAIGGPTLHAVQ